jgi:hypothetical protein
LLQNKATPERLEFEYSRERIVEEPKMRLEDKYHPGVVGQSYEYDTLEPDQLALYSKAPITIGSSADKRTMQPSQRSVVPEKPISKPNARPDLMVRDEEDFSRNANGILQKEMTFKQLSSP